MCAEPNVTTELRSKCVCMKKKGKSVGKTRRIRGQREPSAHIRNAEDQAGVSSQMIISSGPAEFRSHPRHPHHPWETVERLLSKCHCELPTFQALLVLQRSCRRRLAWRVPNLRRGRPRSVTATAGGGSRFSSSRLRQYFFSASVPSWESSTGRSRRLLSLRIFPRLPIAPSQYAPTTQLTFHPAVLSKASSSVTT